MAITLKEIAQTAGVSTMTVSRVLSGNAGNKVSAALAEKIRNIASDRRYRPNFSGKAMRTGFVPLIALCLHRSQKEKSYFNHYLYDLIANFSQVLAGRNMELIFVPYSSTGELAERVGSLKASGLMCGVISNLIPGTAEVTCRILKELKMPFVLLGNPGRDDIPCTYIETGGISSFIMEENSKKGAERMREFRIGDVVSAGECADKGLFFKVSGERECNYLTDRMGIDPVRITIITDMAENITRFGGYVLDHRTGDRCKASLELFTAQLEHRKIGEMRRVIRLDEKDLTWVEPF